MKINFARILWISSFSYSSFHSSSFFDLKKSALGVCAIQKFPFLINLLIWMQMSPTSLPIIKKEQIAAEKCYRQAQMSCNGIKKNGAKNHRIYSYIRTDFIDKI